MAAATALARQSPQHPRRRLTLLFATVHGDNPAVDTYRYFAPDYSQARARFLALAAQRAAQVEHFALSARGPANEPLFLDSAYVGAAQPKRLLIALCGTHGIEGFTGSAIQQRWLDQAHTPAADTGWLFVHAVNPYGFAWQRRANEHNVDLNRNALDRFPGPANPAYARLNNWLNPASPPSYMDFFLLRSIGYLLTQGFSSVKQAIAGGQYEFARGIFYGGDTQQESIAHLRAIFRAPAFRSVERVIALDIHTGLGRFATYKLLVDCDRGSAPYREMERWFGSTQVSGNEPKRSVAYRVSGGLNGLVERCFEGARTYPAVLEFGTVSLVRMISALRRENRAYYYTEHNSPAYENARAMLRATFYPDNREWQRLVLTRGQQVLQQADEALRR